MKNLINKTLGVGMFLGLVGCLNSEPNNEIKKFCLDNSNDYFKIPDDVDYTKIKWDSANVQAIDYYREDGSIYLFDLTFELNCDNNTNTKLIKIFSRDQVRGLEIKTKKDLVNYVKGKADNIKGYIGPMLLL